MGALLSAATITVTSPGHEEEPPPPRPPLCPLLLCKPSSFPPPEGSALLFTARLCHQVLRSQPGPPLPPGCESAHQAGLAHAPLLPGLLTAPTTGLARPSLQPLISSNLSFYKSGHTPNSWQGWEDAQPGPHPSVPRGSILGQSGFHQVPCRISFRGKGIREKA